MIWIGVYKELKGSPKVRRLAKKLKTSNAEVLGLLNLLWFWGLENAETETGKIMDADIEDMQYIFAGETSLPIETIVPGMIEAGWIDSLEEGLFIHDWGEWQADWGKAKARRDRASQYMREYRSRKSEEKKKAEAEQKGYVPGDEVDEHVPEPAPSNEPEPEPEKKKPPAKVEYADFVRMTKEEYERLVEKYGELFTKACIEKLNDYKGSSGKRYKSDYLAIKNWVIERVHEKNPRLMGESRAAMQTEKNPFEEYGEDS